MFLRLSIFVLLFQINISVADHFQGGTISWTPTNPSSTASPVEIIIRGRYSWTLTRYQCNQTIINTFDAYNDTENATSATLTCISSAAACTSSLYQSINLRLYCTDFSTIFKISTGTYSSIQNLALNSVIDISTRGASWATHTLTDSWSLVARIDLTPISGKINSSPGKLSILNDQMYL